MPGHGAQQSHQHLRHAKTKHHVTQSQQFGQIEFQTDDKHQQHHAEFGHRSHRCLALFNERTALPQKNTRE